MTNRYSNWMSQQRQGKYSRGWEFSNFVLACIQLIPCPPRPIFVESPPARVFSRYSIFKSFYITSLQCLPCITACCHYLEGTHIRNLKLQDPGIALELYLRAQLHLHYSCSHFSLFYSPAPTHASPAVRLLSQKECHLHTCLPPKHDSLLPGKAQS